VRNANGSLGILPPVSPVTTPPVGIVFEAQFSHQYTHTVLEHYNEQVPHQTTETYNCGTPPRYQMCTRPVTQYRYEQKTRCVNRTDTVIDGECESTVNLNPKQGSTYLLQFTYQDNKVCSPSCFEQLPAADGTLNQVPCGM
jgi:hypothetical protein